MVFSMYATEWNTHLRYGRFGIFIVTKLHVALLNDHSRIYRPSVLLEIAGRIGPLRRLAFTIRLSVASLKTSTEWLLILSYSRLSIMKSSLRSPS